MKNLEMLIERWRAGDQRAAEMLYDQYKEQTFRLAYGLVGDLEDAEEAAQDALTYALLHIHHFDERRSKFTTWLHTITVSRSRDLLRKRRTPTLSLAVRFGGGQNLADSRPGPEQRAAKDETRDSIWTAIQKLSPVLREATILRHWGSLTYQEIAEIVGCTTKTAQSRVRLAHEKLSRILGADDLQQLAEETP